MTPRTVAVSGPGSGLHGELLELAEEVGRIVAREGFTLLTGGLAGAMAAASRGARQAGGLVVGLLPGDDPSAGNDQLTLSMPTGLGQLRNGLLVNAADGLISIGGSWGTLSEVALAMRTGKPVVCLRGWQLADADGTPVELPRADTAAQAVGLLITEFDRQERAVRTRPARS